MLLSSLVSPINTLLAMITDYFGTEPETEKTAERAFKKMRLNDATAKNSETEAQYMEFLIIKLGRIKPEMAIRQNWYLYQRENQLIIVTTRHEWLKI